MHDRDISECFPHRENEDGTFDSICPVCFLTVAYHKVKFQLAEIECKHVCERRNGEIGWHRTGNSASIPDHRQH